MAYLRIDPAFGESIFARWLPLDFLKFYAVEVLSFWKQAIFAEIFLFASIAFLQIEIATSGNTNLTFGRDGLTLWTSLSLLIPKHHLEKTVASVFAWRGVMLMCTTLWTK